MFVIHCQNVHVVRDCCCRAGLAASENLGFLRMPCASAQPPNLLLEVLDKTAATRLIYYTIATCSLIMSIFAVVANASFFQNEGTSSRRLVDLVLWLWATSTFTIQLGFYLYQVLLNPCTTRPVMREQACPTPNICMSSHTELLCPRRAEYCLSFPTIAYDAHRHSHHQWCLYPHPRVCLCLHHRHRLYLRFYFRLYFRLCPVRYGSGQHLFFYG